MIVIPKDEAYDSVKNRVWYPPACDNKDEHIKFLFNGCREIEIVFCKDCRWWNEDAFPNAFPKKKTSACEHPNLYGFAFRRYTQEDEFCSRGESREK